MTTTRSYEARAARPNADEHRMRHALAAAPFVLLGLSYVFTMAVGGRPVEAGWLPWITAATSLTLALRVWWWLGCSSPRHRIAGFVVNLALTVLLVSLSPLFGVYAFVGYLDAVETFSGRGQPWALLAAASMNAYAQSGGPEGVLRQPWVFGFLLAINGGLAVAMVQVDRHRQRTVTRLQQALEDLEEAHQINEALQDQLLDQARTTGILEERQRLSREIHDTVAQGLIALLRQLEAASEAPTLSQARSILARVDNSARDSLAEARRAVAALASPRLDDDDLPTALATLTASWSAGSGVAATFHSIGDPHPNSHDSALLRVCQEALSNVARHAHASRVAVQLSYLDDSVTLEVADDGTGLDPGRGTTGHGIPGIRTRLAAIGGHFTLATTEGGGCTLRAAIPR
ncbi:MAG: sensor histidine kinase [Actinobacteria bacterium]|nr:sensor histidine kinase [Actinomycetota bacterium]